MNLAGSQRIAAPRDRVWAALNDADILRQAIPGCQSLSKEGVDQFRAVVSLRVGPMDARFTGVVRLSELNPPSAYTITGEGQGGAAGFAKGAAKVSLAEENGATILSYDVDVQVGGRLAQLGGPVVDATAKQLAAAFFKRFGELVAPPPSAAVARREEARSSTLAPAQSLATGSQIAWPLAVAAAFLAGLLFTDGAHHGASGWSGMAAGLLIVVVAAAAFEFGRRASAPTIVLDPKLLRRLADLAAERKE